MAELHAKKISSFPESISVTVPAADSVLHDIVSRWSDSGVAMPYAVMTPSKESDIEAIIQFASSQHLKIVPVNGGHGSYVPVTSDTVCLDLKHFKTVTLDKEKGEVKIGGGSTTRDVIALLKDTGFHTLTPNSNAVGMVGAFLGGLNSAMTGKFGFGIDHVQEIQIIPFSEPKVLTVNPNSTGEEKRLFNVLCGAGHGLGIITSLTLRAFPVANLNLTEDKVWTRRLIFPAAQIETATQLFSSLLPPPPELTPVLVFLRAPPNAPNAGAPMILLGLSFLGSATAAETATAQTFHPAVTERAPVAVTTMINLENLNDANEPLNSHGGFKEYHSAFCKGISTTSIIESFNKWVSFTDENPARGRSFVVFGSWNTETAIRNGGEKDDKFFSARDRGILIQCTPVYTSLEDKNAADAFGIDVIERVREKDRSEGRRNWTFANNLRVGGDVSEIYGEDLREEIERVRNIWDKERVGWGFSDGWDSA